MQIAFSPTFQGHLYRAFTSPFLIRCCQLYAAALWATMTPGLASPRALWHLPPKTESHGQRASGAAGIDAARSPTPQQNEPLAFGRFVPGLPARGCDGGVHPRSLPAGSAHGWTQREGRMRPPGQPRASRQHVPQLPGVPGKAVGCTGQRGTFPGRAGCRGRGIQPRCTTAPELGWLWPRGPALEGSPSNKPPPRKKRQKKKKKSSLFHNPKQQVWLSGSSLGEVLCPSESIHQWG